MDRLLIVDDETPILKSLARLFMDRPYEVLTCEGPHEALKTLDHHSVGVIMTDQRMPGMNGIELLQIVGERHPTTVRVILTGYADVATVLDAVNKGHVYQFITKPWDNDNLRSEIEEAFEHYRWLSGQAPDRDSFPKELVSRERLCGVLEMAGAVSHEMNQPLQVIAGYWGLLNVTAAHIHENERFLHAIGESIQRLITFSRKLKKIRSYVTRDYIGGLQIVDMDKACQVEEQSMNIQRKTE